MKNVTFILIMLFLIILIWPFRKPFFPIKSGHFRIDSLSYWYFPWGNSGVHKGVDIFADKGEPIYSVVTGIVIEKGYGSIAGNFIYILGPQWKTYYFAHLDTIYVKQFEVVNTQTIIGLVGNTGNAFGKPPHLHFSVYSIVPNVLKYDSKALMGWKKMFYLNPLECIL